MTSPVTITIGGPRGQEWARILGTCTLPILRPTTQVCDLEGRGATDCFMLDVNRLTEGQQHNLILYLATKFNAEVVAVAEDVFRSGLPIRNGPDVEVHVPVDYKPPRSFFRRTGSVIDMRFVV